MKLEPVPASSPASHLEMAVVSEHLIKWRIPDVNTPVRTRSSQMNRSAALLYYWVQFGPRIEQA